MPEENRKGITHLLHVHILQRLWPVTCILSTLRASPTTFILCLTSSLATAAPIPELAPVTTATRPAQRSIAAAEQKYRTKGLKVHPCHGVYDGSSRDIGPNVCSTELLH